MNSPAAKLDLVEVAPNGSRIPMRVELGQPRPDGRGARACPVMVDGFDRLSKDIYGEDSLQALCLALRIVRLHLELPLERGSRLVYSDGSGNFSMHTYFERLLDEKPSA